MLFSAIHPNSRNIWITKPSGLNGQSEGEQTLYIFKTKFNLCRIGRAQSAFNLAVEAIEWSGLRKDMRSDLTVNLQEAFINLAKQAEEDGVVFENVPDLTLRVNIIYFGSPFFRYFFLVLPFLIWPRLGFI